MKKFCFIHMLESAKSCCTLFSDSYHVVQDDGFTLKLVSHWQPKLQSFLSRARFDVVCFPRRHLLVENSFAPWFDASFRNSEHTTDEVLIILPLGALPEFQQPRPDVKTMAHMNNFL
ncbi:hypothetical protein SCA6_013813 [Theobroma cacao]